MKVVMLDRLTHEDDLRALEEEIEILSTLQVGYSTDGWGGEIHSIDQFVLNCLTRAPDRHTAPQHKNIVRLHQVFREEGRVYLVQEIASGGELFDRIVSKVRF